MDRDVTPYNPHLPAQRLDALPVAQEVLARYQEDSRRTDLRAVWSFARRNWWILGLCLVTGIVLAYAYNRQADPVYEAHATLELDEQASPLPATFSVFPATSPIATSILILRSRSMAERVVEALALQVQVTEPGGVRRSSVFSTLDVARDARPGRYALEPREGGGFELRNRDGERIQDVQPGRPTSIGGVAFTLAPEIPRRPIEFAVRDFQSAVGSTMGRVFVGVPGGDQRAEILQVTFTDTDPQLAADIVNGLVDNFIDFRRAKQKQTAVSTVDFLQSQLDTLNLELRGAEMAVRKYRETTGTLDPVVETASRLTALSTLRTQQSTLQMEREAIEDVLGQLEARDTTDPLAPSPYRLLNAFPMLAGAIATPLGSLTGLEESRNLLLERRAPTDPDVMILTNQIRRIEEGQLRDQVTTYLERLDSDIAALETPIQATLGDLSEMPGKEFELTALTRESTLLAATTALVQASLKQAEVAKAVDEPNANVIDRAIPPRSSIRPRRGWNLMLGFILGLAAGVIIAYSRQLLDTRIHTREDLRELTGVPVLGLIPRIADMPASLPFPSRRLLKVGDRKKALTDARHVPSLVIAESDRSSAVSEAFRSLRTNITFSSTAERASKVFVLTSATPQDGKTTTAANLSVTFAQQGLRVMLMDADMRRGVLHKLFRISRTPGLSNILVENVELERAIHRVQLENGAEIDVMPTGTVPPNPAELLSAPRMRWLIGQLEDRYDAVVMDTPPLTLVTDAAILASHAHTVLLVARANRTEQGAIHFAIEQLRNVGAPLRGTILNDVDFRRDGYGGKYDYNPYTTAYAPTTEA